jgi:osmotically-inducible protein OsmY
MLASNIQGSERDMHSHKLDRVIRVALLGALAGACLAACGSAPPAPATRSSTPPVPAAALPEVQNSKQKTEDDSTITRNVREQLARELPTAALDVSTAQGKVELRGTVTDAEEARRAVKGALAVEGVRGVLNELTVGPGAAEAEPKVRAASL